MAHVPVAPNAPGIRGLLAGYPDTGRHLSALAEALLRGPSPLTPAEREIIAASVSSRNKCAFCTKSHAATARALLGDDRSLMDAVLADPNTSRLSPKMRALLAIAETVRVKSGPESDVVQAARDLGAVDREIHDTVLIAAAFCMYNRYVDGLRTSEPALAADYDQMGQVLATKGYVGPR